MQCPSCRFENMPGTQACGRCGTQLSVSTAVIDVHPPRARPGRKRIRRWLPLQRGYYRARGAVAGPAGAAADALGERLRVELPAAALWWRFLVPGWAQAYAGLPRRGRLFLSAYLVLLVLGLLFWGTFPGSMALGLAFSVHASSAIDIILRGEGEYPSRMGIAALVAAGLGLFVYLPAGLVLTRFATPYRIQVTTAPFHAGDVVLHNRSAYLFSAPEPGDVVLYDVPYMNTRYLGQNYAIREGTVIDRILAGPESDVTCEEGVLVVNGRKSRWQPLNPAAMPGNWGTTVPANHYLVLPTTSPQWRSQAPTSLWLSVATVPREYIRGSVYLRHQPFWRIWWIR